MARLTVHDDAVERASGPGDALAAAMFTRSLEASRALHGSRVGQVIVNDTTDFRIDAMPFGGPGTAGLGREGVHDAIRALSERRVTCVASR